VKAIVVLFMGEQVVVEQGNAFSRHPQFRWVHDLLRVKVRNKPVPIVSHFFDVCLELGLGKAYRLQQAIEEHNLVRDDFSPIVFAALVAKELAPFQNADIEEVTVGIYPKLVLEYKFAFPPARLVEG